MDRLDCDRMFVAVLETGSLVAGAARLGTSSGQASKLVARLEAEPGVLLLNRTTRAVSATEAGQAYLDRIGAAVLAASAACAALLAAGPALAMGELWLMLEGLDACRIGDFGCGHGFGCPCHLVPPPATAH